VFGSNISIFAESLLIPRRRYWRIGDTNLSIHLDGAGIVWEEGEIGERGSKGESDGWIGSREKDGGGGEIGKRGGERGRGGGGGGTA